MTEIIETFSREDTYELGERMAHSAFPGEIICLDGDLGVGKTVFTKGFAKGLDVREDVVSPTFTILQEYTSGLMPMYHFDVYRVDDPDEMYEVGFEEYIYSDGVTLIEWAELIGDLIPQDAVHVQIEKDLLKGTDYRKITVTAPEK